MLLGFFLGGDLFVLFSFVVIWLLFFGVCVGLFSFFGGVEFFTQ